MHLIISHRTEYHYDTPCHYAIQTLRLSPRPHDGLAVRSWRVRGESNLALPDYTDGYGNLVHTHTVDYRHTAAAVLVEGEVVTTDTGGVLTGISETLPPEFFLRTTQLTEPDSAIRELADGCKAETTLAAMHRLMTAVRDRIDYRVGESEVTTPAAAALAAAAGVCQDHAHVFVAAARVLNVPARYASGYLSASLDGTDDAACHAWAEAFIPELGWVGFDPANRVCPTEAYIRLAGGLDYNEAAPIRGVRRDGGVEQLTVRVRVHQDQKQ